MAVKKKAQKVMTVPSGASFMFTPRPAAGRTPCPGCGKGHTVMYAGSFPTCNGQTKFRCSKRCGWKSPSGKFQHTPTKKQKAPKSKPIKKQHGITDSPELRDAVRKESRRRMKTLIRVRKEIHKPTPKLTDAERERLHKHGFSVMEIRDEIKEI